MTEDATRLRLGASTHALLLVFTLATVLAINPYHYGAADNRITIPLVKAFANPALYPGDSLIGQSPYYYTYLWSTLGALHRSLGLALPALFFGVYLCTVYATFLGLYLVALALFQHRAGAILSLLLLAFARETLAGIPTLDQVLTTRLVAVPLALFALWFFLERKVVRSFALLGVACLIHPLTTYYVLAMLVVASLAVYRSLGLRRLAASLAAFVVVASPLLVWRLQHSPPSIHPFSADPAWLEALRIRSSRHVFPSTWGLSAPLHALVTTALFMITRRRGDLGQPARHAVIGWAVATIMVICLAGTVFAELVPAGFVIMLQPLRAFVFLEYFTMIYLAHYFTVPAERSRPVTDAVVALLAGVWFGYASETTLRPSIEFVVAALAITVLRFGWLHSGRFRRFAAATACLVCLAAGVTYALEHNGEPTPPVHLTSGEPTLWLEVERWARSHTEVRDAFIVPPDPAGTFRAESERTIYSDWVEGGLMNFNPAFGLEWMRRMRRLGFIEVAPGAGENFFCDLPTPRLLEIAAEMDRPGRRVFLVWPCLDRTLELPVRYRNAGYVVYEIPRGAAAPH